MSCPILKFNDYKKKQERNFLITTHAVYNLKDTDIKRRIQLDNIKGLSISRIGPEFVLHVPSEYDYRYAADKHRDKIIYYILKAARIRLQQKLPIYYRDEMNLAMFSMTKEDKKKYGVKEITGKFALHDDETFKTYLDHEE